MRKLHVVYGLNDLGIGGMQRQFVEQMRLIDTERFTVSVVTLFSFPGRTSLYDKLPSHVTVYQLAFSSIRDLRSWLRLYRLLKTLMPDVVVTSLFFSNTVFRVLKPLIGYPIITREHNTYVAKPRLHRLIDRLLAFWSFCIVAVSHTVAEFTARQEGIPRSRFRVIANGIDLARADEALATLPDQRSVRRTLGLPPDALVILSVARLASQKNHAALIDGFLACVAKEPRLRLVIVGDGEYRSALSAQAGASSYEDRILFAGEQQDVWAYYKAADFFASTSYIEGLSNAYLEALAAGLPLLATRTAGTDELLEDGKNGYAIVEPTGTAFGETLSRALRHDRAPLSAEARETAARFALSATVREYEQLFMEAANHS